MLTKNEVGILRESPLLLVIPKKAQGCPGNLTQLRGYRQFNHRVVGGAWDIGKQPLSALQGGEG